MSDPTKRRATDAELAKLLGTDFVSEHGLIGSEPDVNAPPVGEAAAPKPGGATSSPAAGKRPTTASTPVPPAPAPVLVPGAKTPAATSGVARPSVSPIAIAGLPLAPGT